MAELGPIQFTDLERGAVRPSSGRELAQGIAQTLDTIGKIHVDDVLGDFREDAADIVAEAREEASTATVFEAPSSLTGEEAQVQRRAGVLKAQIERGNSSQRALAELKLKQLLNKYQNENNALATHLQQTYGQVVSASAQLDEIGLVDSINAANAKAAEKNLKDMVDFATKPVDQNGLGINPAIPVESAEFARQYTLRSQARDMIETNKLSVQFAASAQDMQAREKAGRVTKAMQGNGNLVNAGTEQWMPELIRYRSEMAKPAEQRDLGYLEDFAVNIRPAMIEDLNYKKLEMMQALDQIFTPQERTTAYYSEVKAINDDVVSQVDALITALSGDDLRAMDHWMAANRIRNANYRRSRPDYDWFLSTFDPESEGFKSFYESVAKYDTTGQGVITGQDIANRGFNLLGPLLEGIPQGERAASIMDEVGRTGGQGKVDDRTQTKAIHDTLRANWATSDGFYGIANSTEEDDIKRSIAHLELLRRESVSAVEQDSPFTAGQFMTTATNAILVMDAIGNPGEQQMQLTEEILADPNVYKASLLEGNGQNRYRRIAMGEAAQEFWANSRPLERKQQYQQQLMQPAVGGQPLLNFIEVKTGDAPEESAWDTELIFEINKRYLRDQLAAIGQQGGDDAHAARITKLVAPIMDQINAQIRTRAHTDAWLQPTISEDTADYLNAANNEGWLDFFGFRE